MEPGTRSRVRCRPCWVHEDGRLSWGHDPRGRIKDWAKWSTKIEDVTCKGCKHLYRIDLKRTPANDNGVQLAATNG